MSSSKYLHVTSQMILDAQCSKCNKSSTEASLFLGDFYFCPTCGRMYCSDCYPKLPLTQGSYGYGKCPKCDEEVQRAFPGTHGKKPLRKWWQFWELLHLG